MSEYLKMSAGDMLQALGDDAQKWAEAFRELHPEIEQEVMFGWFANAIEHSGDVRLSRLVHDERAWLDHIDSISQQRRWWQELALQNAHPSEAARERSEHSTAVTQLREDH